MSKEELIKLLENEIKSMNNWLEFEKEFISDEGKTFAKGEQAGIKTAINLIKDTIENIQENKGDSNNGLI